MGIKCCLGCVAPKRFPGCHGTCPEYIKEKALHDAAREEDFKVRSVKNGLTSQKFRGVGKAEKHKRKRWGT